MTDLAKCAGKDCPQRDTCLRFTAPASEWQAWSSFDSETYRRSLVGVQQCDGYWPLRPSTQQHNGSNE